MKNVLRVSLLTAYITVWFGFGLYYQISADDSRGKKFIFNQDLASHSKHEAFTKKVLFRVDYPLFVHLLDKAKAEGRSRTCLALIPKDESSTNALAKVYGEGMLGGSKVYACFCATGKISGDWGMYYMQRLAKRFLGEFRLEELPNVEVPGSPKGKVYKLSISFEHFWDEDIGPTLLSLPENKCPYSDEYILVITDETIRKEFGELKTGLIAQIDAMKLMPKSLILPNRDYEYLLDISEGAYKYKLADFLYFSAVTITTLGYGDILPNDTGIRIGVMIETFLGLILVGFFISSFFISRSGEPKPPLSSLRKRRFRPIPPPKRRYR